MIIVFSGYFGVPSPGIMENVATGIAGILSNQIISTILHEQASDSHTLQVTTAYSIAKQCILAESRHFRIRPAYPDVGNV